MKGEPMSLSRRGTGLISVLVFVAASLIIVVTAEAVVQGVLTKRRVNELDATAGSSDGNGYLAWTQAPAARASRTRVMGRRNGNTFRVSRKGTRAYAGGISGSTLLYQEIKPRRNSSNIFGFNMRTKKRSVTAKSIQSGGSTGPPSRDPGSCSAGTRTGRDR